MTEKFVSERNLRFLLHEVFDASCLISIRENSIRSGIFSNMNLPKSEGLAKSLLASNRLTVEMKKDFF